MGNIFCKTTDFDKEMITKIVFVIDESDHLDKKFSYSKLFCKTYYLRLFGHDFVMLYIKMEGWSTDGFCLRLRQKIL